MATVLIEALEVAHHKIVRLVGEIGRSLSDDDTCLSSQGVREPCGLGRIVETFRSGYTPMWVVDLRELGGPTASSRAAMIIEQGPGKNSGDGDRLLVLPHATFDFAFPVIRSLVATLLVTVFQWRRGMSGGMICCVREVGIDDPDNAGCVGLRGSGHREGC